MAERENPFTVMKRYLANLNKRVEELSTKSNSLEDQIKSGRSDDVEAREKLSSKIDAERTEINGKLEDINSKLSEQQTQVLQSIEQMKQDLAEMKSFAASKQDLEAAQRSLQEDISSLRDHKLDKSEFQEFTEKNDASIKEVFDDLAKGETFADFASGRAASHPPPPSAPIVEAPIVEAPVVEEPAPTPSADETPAPAETPQPAEEEPAPAESYVQERRREEKRKKKWL